NYPTNTSPNPNSPTTVTGFYAVHVWLLPFMEEKAIYDLINFQYPITAGMDSTSIPNYKAWAQAAGIFICPSDQNTGSMISENNYRYNFGGATTYAGATSASKNDVHTGPTLGNGAFTYGKALSIKDFPDGLSKTAFFSERNKGSLHTSSQPATHDDVVI